MATPDDHRPRDLPARALHLRRTPHPRPHLWWWAMTTAITPKLMPRRQAAAPAPRPTGTRRDILLTAIRQRGGIWTTGRARAFYATALGKPVHKPDVRRDFGRLVTEGHLDRHEVSGRVSYTLRTKGGTA